MVRVLKAITVTLHLHQREQDIAYHVHIQLSHANVITLELYWQSLALVRCRRDVIRKSARQEFETTRHHTDPEMVGGCRTDADALWFCPAPILWVAAFLT